MKDFFAYSVSAIITVILLEIVSLVFFNIFYKEEFGYEKLQKERLDRMSNIIKKLENTDDSQDLFVFHPYIGYVNRPDVFHLIKKDLKSNEYGMFSRPNYVYPYKKQENDFVFAVVGGSVAAGFTYQGENYLKTYLKGLGFDKNLVLINLAKGGYKQPQQLFHLQYALLSGFEFDGVLNIDGFNDLVLATQNIDNQINPTFPSGHHMGMLSKMRTSHQFNRKMIEQLSQYYSLYENELFVLSSIQESFLRNSILLNVFGKLWTDNNISKLKELEYNLLYDSQRTMTQEFRGPQLLKQGNKYEISSQIWQHASEMLYAICKANNLIYIHALQPNQYVAESKPLSENEKKHAFAPDLDWSIAAKEGYKYLILAGQKLKNKGLPFYDLTMLFKHSTDDIYIDVCCHFNEKGNALMAKALADIIFRSLTSTIADVE